MGRAHPSSMLHFFFLSFVSFICHFITETPGVEETGIPYYNRASWSRVGKGYLEKPAVVPRGAAASRCHGPSGPM